MRLVSPEERLTKLEFNADQDRSTYPPSVYACQNCGERIGFALKDLDRHHRSDFTNLSPSDAQAADEVISGVEHDAESFIDFYCTGCRWPVRIYYRTWAGGRWTYGYVIRAVVEGEPTSSCP